MTKSEFHLSLPCENLSKTITFYTDVLGFQMGRSGSNWCDINFMGHQITFNQARSAIDGGRAYKFENSILPSFHLGVILSRDKWEETYRSLEGKDLIMIAPIRFLSDKVGAHESFFIQDPDDYYIEFKCFDSEDAVFDSN